jgi:hypothetical protein
VLEPEDTRQRTRNLRQTNTNGYKFQGTPTQLRHAEKLVKGWGRNGRAYKPTLEYQAKLRQLFAKFRYRLDTNYAKMDRIEHRGIEAFKTSIGRKEFHGIPVSEWTRILTSEDDATIRRAVEVLGIRDSDASALVR